LAEDVLGRLAFLYSALKDKSPKEVSQNQELMGFATELHEIWREFLKTDKISLKNSEIDQLFFDRTLLTVRRALELTGAVKE